MTWATYVIAFRDGHSITIVAKTIGPALDKAVQISNELHEREGFGYSNIDPKHTKDDITRVDEAFRPVHVAEEVDDGGD